MSSANPVSLPGKLARFARRLRGDCSGLALIEFAFAAPLVLGMGMLGTETAYMVITHLQVSQIAMQVADNASRVGEQDVLTARKVYERDIAETLIGAEKLGATMDIFEQGRVIVSSLQQNAQGGQWIAWQRCRGAKRYDSTHGLQGAGATGTSFPGMGSASNRITASSGTAVMFVEVAYDYRSPTPISIFDSQEIVYTAAFNVRDNRDLTRLYSGGPVASCSTYSAARPT
ncbi:TadE/TadG family type IV pilus assembly protein [Erythrobacter sp. BLCC-B19]|uniref:TadE/TadG family type IV pilus assembly protein n=1 Tax=Erythrobacter sp. BLCC-B19 TaxID=3025315 RepID=UPI0023603E7E|nr:hypothetical protein [Erythrobacter sp. BLCC-B19]WDA40711.1 hypothetical protein PS060_14235 [Erythrobacter sp. BLCC-B19]